ALRSPRLARHGLGHLRGRPGLRGAQILDRPPPPPPCGAPEPHRGSTNSPPVTLSGHAQPTPSGLPGKAGTGQCLGALGGQAMSKAPSLILAVTFLGASTGVARAQLGKGWVQYSPPSVLHLEVHDVIKVYPPDSTDLTNEGAHYTNKDGIE